MGKDSLGELEQLVLLAVLRLGDDAYGMSVVEEIRRRTGRKVSRAAVYVVLRRARRKGVVSSGLGEPTPERGGRAKRFYRVAPEGLELLRDSRDALLSMWEGLDALLDEA